MIIDWVSVGLAIMIIVIFVAIFTLLRLMSSPYIKRFEPLVKGAIEEIPELEESYRLKFSYEGRGFELLELKSEAKRDFKKVYDSFVILKAYTNTNFTLRLDDVLSRINVAGVLEDELGEKIDHTAFEVNAQTLGPFFKDFRVSTNDAPRAEKILTNEEVLSTLGIFKTQFSAYGFLMPLTIRRGVVILDYSLSEGLVNDLVYNSRNLLEHARLLHRLAGHIETNAS